MGQCLLDTENTLDICLSMVQNTLHISRMCGKNNAKRWCCFFSGAELVSRSSKLYQYGMNASYPSCFNAFFSSNLE